MALASRRCLTTLTSHGASLLSHLQRLKPPTASRSLCDSSLIERDSAIPTQYRRRFDLTMEMEKVLMGYKFNEPYDLEKEEEERKEREKKRKEEEKERRQYFKPSVLFYVGKQPYHALKGDIIYTERLNHPKVKGKVYFVRVALLSLDKHRFMMHLKTGQLLADAYVETAFEGHVKLFGKDLTKLRVLDFGLDECYRFNLV